MISSYINIRRYYGLIVLGLSLLLAMELINGVIIAALGWNPVVAFLPAEFTELAESKAVNLKRHYPAGTTHEPYLVYLGASSAAEAIDAKRLTEKDAYGGPVCGICGILPGFEILQSLAEPLVRHDVRPNTMMVCMHLGYLARDPNAARPPMTSLDRFKAMFMLGRILKSRTAANNSIRNSLFFSRQYLNIPEQPRSPWDPVKRMGYAEYNPQQYLDRQLSHWTRSGWFDAATYQRFQQQNVDLLVDLLRRLQPLGSDNIIVLLPEHHGLRDGIPKEALVYLRTRLDAEFREKAPQIWNFTDQVPDNMFADYIHVNDRGRAALTELLAAKLHDYRLKHP